MTWWSENYGDSRVDVKQTLMNAVHAVTTGRCVRFDLFVIVCTDSRVLLLGLLQSLFEASMYTFVFMWTPALTARGDALPLGLIFACYMV